MGVVVHLDKFSGPLALLLHLIRREEMDIFDINITEITKQYLESIRAMKKLNLETAGDFIAMAATLIQIKSKMLLPQYNEEGEVIEQEDPRKDLVKRLLEYQMYQDAGRNLYNRELKGRDTWARGTRENLDVGPGEIVMEEENALYSMISLYRNVIKNMKKAVHKVAESLQSIADRVWQMRERLVVGQTTQLSLLLDKEAPDKKGHLLITFLSLLELAKVGIVNLFQGENFADIHIDTKKEIDRDVISKVESYESQVSDLNGPLDIFLSEEDRKPDEVPPVEKISEGELTQAEMSLLENEEMPVDELGVLSEAHANASLLDGETAMQAADALTKFQADETYEIQAATDEEIELEEKMYGEEI